MLGRLAWILPAIFLALAVTYVILGYALVATLYLAVAVGMAMYGAGVRSGVAPLQWFGAAISMFALVILVWVALGPLLPEP